MDSPLKAFLHQPGPLGWLGNFLVVLGTLGIVYPSIGKGNGSLVH
jgi:hypothetical protein